MSPNAPVPPPPPPPGGVPGTPAARRADTQVDSTTAWSAGAPPTFAPSAAPAQRSHEPAYTDGPATVVQAAVPAPSPASATAVPPQRVRYATDQAGFAAVPTQSAAYAPPPGYAPPPAYAPSPAQAPSLGGAAGTPAAAAPATQPAYHPPSSAAAPTSPARGASSGGGPVSPPPAGRAGGRGGSGRGSSGRLSPGWIAFIVVDVLLVIGAVVFAISLLGGGGGADDPADPGAAPSAGTTQGAEPTTQAPTETAAFASETRNIACEMTDVGVTCSIAELATQPAPVSGCEGTVGYRVVLDDAGVNQPCVPAAEQPQPAADGVEVLPYGQSKTVGGYTCDSENTGVTCRDEATGKGFTVAKAGIRSL